LRNSLVRNTKRGLSPLVRLETSYSRNNWILRSASACSMSCQAKKRLRLFSGNTNGQGRRVECGSLAGPPVSLISIQRMQSSARGAFRDDASLLLRTTANGAIPGSWSSDGPLDLPEVRSQMQISIMRGKVYLMGAGPGAAELLPTEAVSLLRAAEVVLHDEAVSPEVLELVSASAQVRNVDRLIDSEAVSQDKILSLLISAARDGRQVVRLRSVDTLTPEHVAEELEALIQANVDCEVIPVARQALATAAGKNSAR